MFGLGQHAQFPKLFIKVIHKCRYSCFDGTEVVILQLLPLWRGGAKEGTSGVDEVGTLVIHFFVDEEIFLLGTDCSCDAGDFIFAQKMKHFYGDIAQSLH